MLSKKTGACCRVEATTQSSQQVNQVCANQSNAVQDVNQEEMTETETSSTESMSEKKEKSWKDLIAKKAIRVAEKTSSIASDASHTISKKTSVTLNRSKIVISDFANSTAKGIKDTVESIALQSKVKFKDDVNLMQQECGLLNNLTTTKSSPALFQSLLYACAGMGLLSNKIELARLSRSIMDVDCSPQQKLIEMMFGETQVMEISKWMDSVPGFNAIGGGVTHRIQHGHDIGALVELAQSHNMAGVSEWLNHVVLRFLDSFWNTLFANR